MVARYALTNLLILSIDITTLTNPSSVYSIFFLGFEIEVLIVSAGKLAWRGCSVLSRAIIHFANGSFNSS